MPHNWRPWPALILDLSFPICGKGLVRYRFPQRMGTVCGTSIGLGTAPALRMTLHGGYPDSSPCVPRLESGWQAWAGKVGQRPRQALPTQMAPAEASSHRPSHLYQREQRVISLRPGCTGTCPIPRFYTSLSFELQVTLGQAFSPLARLACPLGEQFTMLGSMTFQL